MSSFSSSAERLRITELNLEGEGAWPDLQVENLSPGLNLFFGPPRSGKSSLAQLVAHLMYGKSESAWRRQFGQAVTCTEGAVQLDGHRGAFTLRRQFAVDRQPKLTISSTQGDAVDGQTIQSLLSGLSPELASKVFALDFAQSPRADWLLSEAFSREIGGAGKTEVSRYSRESDCYCSPQDSVLTDRVDGQRIDELVKRRDAIAAEIEQQMALRRSESDVLERELKGIDDALQAKRARIEQLRLNLLRLDGEIAELESRLRYHSLDQHVKSYGPQVDGDQHQRELAEIDEEITRCRRTISETQRREQWIRAELAEFGADGTADKVTCLADGRATLGVLEQLLDDLDVEVSQLASTHQPGRCFGHDSHSKLKPVADLLRQQVYTLCGQMTEQERIVRRESLTAELQQLTRVHTELGDRLDLLLSRRESMVQQAQVGSRPARLMPQTPALNHCQCEHHATFVQHSDAMILARSDRGRIETDARAELAAAQQERAQRLGEYESLQGELQQLESRWEVLQGQRAGLISRASIEQQQEELDRLEAVIRQSLEVRETRTISHTTSHWRASDILAQLSDGQLVQIRVDRQVAQPTIVDRQGQLRLIDSLNATEQDQLYLSLALSLVSSYATKGIHLPLVLDEPFLRQDAKQAATMLTVLAEFARTGHQLLVFTEDRDVARRSEALHATRFDLESLRQTRIETVVAPTPIETPATVQTTSTRIVRESFDGHTTPALRLATVEGEQDRDDLFYLTESASFSDFPVLGADTNAIFRQINILSVSDLLAADATRIADQLGREGITDETVRLWQIHTALMCFVPNFTLDDAQVLAANGINSPADLFDADVDALFAKIDGFLSSERGQRFQRHRNRYSRSRLSGWRDGSRRYRNRWDNSSRRYSSSWRQRRSRRDYQPRTRQTNGRTSDWESARERSTPARRTSERSSTTRSNRSTSRSKKFYLGRTQDVEDAPSIGPKTAERLAKVGIRSVDDLLNADPESVATELDVSHITAAILTDWQHQARLVCQIPGMRGYGAQLLVACGLTQPEQIAGTPADKLIAQVLAYCETKEGQRILRSGDPPKVEKISEWVELAAQFRPLEAA